MFSTHQSAALRERLEHVYWLGGGSGAGKSTVARRLAARHGLRLYATDEAMADHGRRMAAFASRGSLREIAGKTSDPERALWNLLERDRMFTERLRGEAAGLGLSVIEVDVTMTEDDLAERVERALGLSG